MANERKGRSHVEEGSGHWFDAIFKEYEAKGDFDNLPGKGKPIPRELITRDALDGILADANYRYPWMELQQEIRDTLAKLVEYLDYETKPKAEEIDQINQKIRKYNLICPPSLQKRLVNHDNIRQRYEQWK